MNTECFVASFSFGALASLIYFVISSLTSTSNLPQKQSFIVVLRKSCSENMQQIYSKTPMQKCDFNKVHSNFIEMKSYLGMSVL